MFRLSCLPRLPRAKRGGAESGESTSCRLRFAVCGPTVGDASPLRVTRNDILAQQMISPSGIAYCKRSKAICTQARGCFAVHGGLQ